MRAALLFMAAAAAGCDVDCGPPHQVNGTYAVFANVITYDGTNLDEFPSTGSPANGWREWALNWPNSYSADVDVAVDGFDYMAAGEWDPLVCGNFTLAFGGTYVSPALGSTHEFEADGDMAVFGVQLEGRWNYSETWTTADGDETGTFTAEGQIAGSRIDESD